MASAPKSVRSCSRTSSERSVSPSWSTVREIGGIFAENWRAWNFAIKDAGGNEVARITKTFEGLLKTAFTTADNYVLQVHHQLPDPLRQMVYASAVTIDTALKQDSRGISGGGMLDMLGN